MIFTTWETIITLKVFYKISHCQPNIHIFNSTHSFFLIFIYLFIIFLLPNFLIYQVTNTRFHHTVLTVRRASDYAQTGKWSVKWRDAEGVETEEDFDCVLMAQGHHAKPKLAQFPGQDQFQGRIMHSHDYKDTKGFEVKNV